MANNLYSKAAEAPILNTYVPIDFNLLYRIGLTLKEAVDQATKDLSNAVLTFGLFQSPSQVDTKNYYDATIGKVSDLILEASTNPDAMKDASFRQRLQSRINNLDYSALSNYKQSAENLSARLKIVAQMLAEGKYNKDWDNIDISNWDTSKAGTMTNLAPIKYVTANELSNQYFDNMRPGALGQVMRNGVKYNLTGNNYNDLKSIAEAHYNDLINTPQGQQYYKQLLAQNNGDDDAAKSAFTTMIANSQIDRTLRPAETVDPLWLLQAREAIHNNQPKVSKTMPTRLDFINSTISRTATNNLGNLQTQGNYRNYIAGLVNKYGKDSEIGKTATKGVKNIDNLMKQASTGAYLYQWCVDQYNKTGDDEYLIYAAQQSKNAQVANTKVLGLALKYTLLSEFKKVSGFDAYNKQPGTYSTEGYIKGINRALDNVKSKINIGDNDALLQGVGGQLFDIIDKNTGAKHNAFLFNDSKGFVLPETVFQAFTETTPRVVKRGAGLLRNNEFPAKELIESGLMLNIQFIPDGSVTKLGNNIMTSGKIRIPKLELEDKLGTGLLHSGTFSDPGAYSLPFGRLSTKNALKNMFGANKVTEAVGSDGIDYYELDAFRALPSEQNSPEYWLTVNQRWQGAPAAGGIGGPTQANATYMTSAEQLNN